MKASRPTQVRLVLSRELLDYRRQRRVWRRLFLQPLLLVLLLSAPVLLLRSAEAETRKATFTVGVQGDVDAVPGLRASLEKPPLKLRTVDDGGRAVVSDAADTALVVPGGARDLVSRGEPVPLRVLAMPAENDSRFASEALSRRLAELREQRAAEALSVEGLPRALVAPFDFKTVDLSVSSGQGTRFGLGQAIPPLLVIQLFGLMAAAEERLAGAKDRRVLEPLLVLPFRRIDILLGIGAATMSAGLAAAGLLFIPLVVGLSVAVAAISDTVAGPLEVTAALLVGVVLFGLVFTALGLYAGARAHSGGEGSVFVTVAQVTVFAVMSVTPFLAQVQADGPLLLVPVLGPMLLVRDAVASGFEAGPTALTLLGAVAVTGLLLRRAVALVDSEGSVLRAAR